MEPNKTRETQLQAILHAYLQAVDRGEQPDRQALLDAHPAQRDELAAYFADESKLRNLAHSLATQHFAPVDKALTLDSMSEASAEPTLPRVRYFGDYELLDEIARGGMGVVFKARQVSLNRTVALKMILKGELATEADVRRFHQEAEAAGNLDHPHIVPIYEVGVHQGQHYFSMKLIETQANSGRSSGESQRAIAHRLALVARAVHHAHQRGILHRDLKPSNILIDTRGEPHVADFGLAKRVHDDAAATRSGAIVGTPAYMAPEQAQGVKPLTTAVDVYSLGAILYEWLTGRPPFVGEDALATLLQVVSEEPAKPRSVKASLDRDLETICLKCLEKEPAKRYGSAEALADDLDHWQRGEPIVARPAGALERAVKWARRRPALAALLAASSVGAVLVLLGGLYFTHRVQVERNEALAQEGEARKQRNEALAQKGEAQKQRNEAITQEVEARKQRKLAEDHAADAKRELDNSRRSLFSATVWRAAGIWERDPLQGRQLLLETALCPNDFRDFAWGHYLRRCHLDGALLRGYKSYLGGLAISPNGKLVATAHYDGTIKLWDLATRKDVATLRGHGGAVAKVEFSPAGNLLASAGADGTIKLWDVAAKAERATLQGHLHGVTALAFVPGGKHLVSGGGWYPPNYKDPNTRFRDGEVRVWDIEGRKEVAAPLHIGDSAVYCLAVSPDGRWAAAGLSHGNCTLLFDLKAGKEVARLTRGHAWNQAVAFSPDSQTLAIGTSQLVVCLWDLPTRKVRHIFKGHQQEVEAVAYSADGRTIASGDLHGQIKLWNAATGDEELQIATPHGVVTGLAFTPDGRELLSGHFGTGQAAVWSTTRQRGRTVLAGDKGVSGMALSADGTLLAYSTLTGPGRSLQLRNLATGDERTLTRPGIPGVVALSADAQTVAFATLSYEFWQRPLGKDVQVWSTKGGKLAVFPTSAPIHSLALTPDGSLLFAVTATPEVLVWDVAARKALPPPGGSGVTALALAPEGRFLALAYAGDIHVLDGATRAQRGTLPSPGGKVLRLAFSPDCRFLAAADDRGQIQVWNLETKAKLVPSGKLTEQPLCLAFTPDGRTLALGCPDRHVKLMDVATAQIQAVLQGHSQEVHSLAFTPDGRMLISAGGPYMKMSNADGGEIILWETEPYR